MRLEVSIILLQRCHLTVYILTQKQLFSSRRGTEERLVLYRHLLKQRENTVFLCMFGLSEYELKNSITNFVRYLCEDTKEFLSLVDHVENSR